jgi:hypothetical protein
VEANRCTLREGDDKFGGSTAGGSTIGGETSIIGSGGSSVAGGNCNRREFRASDDDISAVLDLEKGVFAGGV